MNELMNNDALGKLIVRLTVGILMLFHGAASCCTLAPSTLSAATLPVPVIPEVPLPTACMSVKSLRR